MTINIIALTLCSLSLGFCLMLGNLGMALVNVPFIFLNGYVVYKQLGK